MGEFKTYSIPQVEVKGVTDLQDIYAWRGNSQGNESCTNDVQRGLNSQGWMSPCFTGVDCTDQVAVDAEVTRRKQANTEYIDSLVRSGEYRRERHYNLELNIKYCPLWDDPKPINPNIESYRMVFLDCSKHGE